MKKSNYRKMNYFYTFYEMNNHLRMFVRDVIPSSNLEVFENLHEQDSKLTVIETRSVWYTPDDCLTSKSREIIFSRRISRSAYNTLQNIFRTNRYQGSKDSSQSLDPASDQCYHRTKWPMRFQRFEEKSALDVFQYHRRYSAAKNLLCYPLLTGIESFLRI